MHTRQSGAAHVPMMFFLLLLIMFLGALGFAYVKLTENGDLLKQRNEARAASDAATKRELLLQHYIEDIGKVIGKPGKYVGRDGSRGVYGDASIEAMTGLMNPSDIKRVFDEACRACELGEASGLENVLGAMVTRMSQLKAQASNADLERDKALVEMSELDRKFQEAVRDSQNRAREWNQNLENAREAFANNNAEKDRTISNLQQNLNNKVDELTTTRETAAELEKGLRAELAKKEMHTSALIGKDRMRAPPDVADGKIIGARTGVASAFINLGKKDNLQAGTVFRVRNPHSDKVKAYAVVTRVEEERAEVSLSGIVDPIGDYVREGDQLFNDIYSPNLPRTIFLLGRFSAPYEKDRLATLLKRLGNKVVDKIGPGVDTVILGDDPINEAGDGFAAIKDSPEFKEANNLGVEMVPLRKIRDLVRL